MENVYNQYFSELLDYTVGEIRSNGYAWYKEEFEGKLIEAEKSLGIDAQIISQAWMVAGDVWDINKVPLRAIDCYRKAEHWNNNNAEASFELASLYMKVGAYNKAIHFIQKALKIDGSSRAYLDVLHEAVESEKNKEVPYFNANNLRWLYAEQMAEGQFNEVLDALHEVKEIDLLQIKAQCYGALKNHKAYIETWKTIYDAKACFELQWADWFYMPEQIINSATIWEMLIQMNSRIVASSVFEIYNLGYTDHEPSAPQMRTLSCLYRIYCANKSVGGLQTLLNSFPFWTEVQNELSFLKIIDDEMPDTDQLL